MYSAANTIWVLLGAALVFFMQAGFAMVETGFTRSKNAGNIIMKNLMDFCIGTPFFWMVGFGIMFGSGNGIIGWFDLFTTKDYSYITPSGIPFMAFFIFQTVFCATAATIVSGAMAERTKFVSYCLYSAIISLIVYPVSGHWIWGGGWLSELGFHDFAGSTAVHMVGGIAAFIGAKILGPRIGKYSKEGKSRAIPGHSLTLGALGVFILWFCWFGFNGCSTVAMDTDAAMESAAHIFVTTNLSAAVATCTTMLFTWFRYGKPDISMTLNGSLAGLVAITAGCDIVSPGGAAIIGIIAGIVVVLAIEFIDKKFKVDDPVGAVGVHGCCGALGTILTGFFATDGGFLYGGGFHFLGVQILGVVSVILWVTVAMTIVFTVLNKTVGLRVSEKEEVEGLDKSEHGIANAYADFVTSTVMTDYTEIEEKVTGTEKIDVSVPVQIKTNDTYTASDVKLTKVEIIAKQEKFEALKNALNDIGINGMTVTHVMGCGMQKGAPEYYRGIPIDMQLLPKIQIEIVVAKVPVIDVINTARKVLYTGHIGDGKIFVYNVENAIKVRTGEEGYDAMQGRDE